MEKSNIMIRLEKKEEHQKVENLVRESFWNVYRPGCLEHYVLHQLRNDSAFVPELDFVMFLNENGEEGKLIGQNMFMRTSIKADDGRNIPIMTMGPICITPELKRGMTWRKSHANGQKNMEPCILPADLYMILNAPKELATIKWQSPMLSIKSY